MHQNNFFNPGGGGPQSNRPPNVGPPKDPYDRKQHGGVMAPQGMFDAHAKRGWDRGPFQLDPDQQQRYNQSDKNRYGYGNSYYQGSGQAPWHPEIWT